MRILHVQETLSPRYGGPATVLPQLTKAQAAAGHDVVVATTTADHPTGVYHEPGWSSIADGAVKVLYAPVQFAPLRISLPLAAFLRRSMAEFDIVHVHGLYRFPQTAAAYLARKQGVPYIIRPHGSLDPYLYERSTTGKLRLKRAYERWFDLPSLRHANAIHYTAAEERDKASFLELPAPSFVLPNGLDWEPYRTLPARGALRRRLGLGDEPVVLFLGRLHPKKGLDLLIPAFDSLRRSEPNAQLVIAGPENDDYGDKVREWIRMRNLNSAVHLVGALHGPEIVQAYVDADVFALPSYTENFGVTVAEAMACAVPVAISDQVNIHDAVSGAGAGLVTRCDVEEVCAALLALLRDPDRSGAMGRAGRQLVQERYAWPAIVDEMTKEYESAIEWGRRAGAPTRRGHRRGIRA